MTVTAYEIRSGAYYDSVVLMHLQRELAGLDGVADAGVVMATPANRDLMAQSELLPDDAQAGPDDLLVVVRADSEALAKDALAQIDELMARRRSTVSQTFRPRSLEAASKMLPAAHWVVVSVPGRYAAGVAREALALGKHVFLYSDNVSLEDEAELKASGVEQGLLVMGPDCGTAIINGVGLGFANRVRRGGIGVVGASGTGMQAITTRVHKLGAGISHAIGTGGRDLKSEVGALTTRQGLDLLGRDPDTGVIVLVSKPPDPEVASQVLSVAQATRKPVVVNFIGHAPPARKLGNLHFATTLSEAAEMAVSLRDSDAPASAIGDEAASAPTEGRRYVRGLFAGGTLAYEALRGLEVNLTPLYSNVPIRESQRLADPLHSQAHTVLDLGEDVFTVGRLHPMMDNDLRLRRLRQEAADPEVAHILLDVVLGEGAHPDPASELAPVIAEVRQTHGVEVTILLVGTDEDPQDIEAQRERLAEAGATLFEDTAEAVAHVSQQASHAPADHMPPVALAQLNAPLAAINVGIEIFYESLTAQGAQTVQVDWRPPAGGDEKLLSILEKMRK